jgi:hypothetical protein
MKATSYINAALDQEGHGQTLWCSKWIVHVGKPCLQSFMSAVIDWLAWQPPCPSQFKVKLPFNISQTSCNLAAQPGFKKRQHSGRAACRDTLTLTMLYPTVRHYYSWVAILGKFNKQRLATTADKYLDIVCVSACKAPSTTGHRAHILPYTHIRLQCC